MSTYKVIQDIEAEDKLIGPLTLRQFIYAGIAALFGYLSFFFYTHGAAFMVILFLPVVAVCGFFAFPWGRDQPTEVWALAKVRFLLKPRRRIWDMSSAKELVTITAPKQVAHNYTNGLSQDEVRSRLHALASTIDSRGWAVKNANLNLYQSPLVMASPASDRLVAPSSLPQPVDSTDVKASDDILDEKNNAAAQRLDSMINKSAESHHNEILERMQKADPPQPAPKAENYWFLNQPAPSVSVPENQVTFSTQVVTPGAAPATAGLQQVDDAGLLAQLNSQKRLNGQSHLHSIQPLSDHPAPPPLPPVQQAQPVPQTASATPPPVAAIPAQPPVTPAKQAAILQLASNDDLDVATIAREAERAGPQDEVVIKLH